MYLIPMCEGSSSCLPKKLDPDKVWLGPAPGRLPTDRVGVRMYRIRLPCRMRFILYPPRIEKLRRAWSACHHRS
jgi:hypothetical protein